MLNLRSGSLHAAFLLLCAVGGGQLFAQSTSGTITGRVSEASEQSVPGATVTLLNDRTGDKQTATTNEVGLFVLPSLRPGVYSIRIEKQAFQTYELTSVTLSANERLSLGEIRLQIGAVTQKVTVEAVGSQVQTASSEHSAQLTASQINMIQVRGRNVVGLLRLLPGVTNTGDLDALGDGSGTVMPTMQGLQSSAYTTFAVDGLTGNTLGNVNSAGSAVNMDAIAEVTVMLNNYQAEYGRNGGASINIVTKSGTRDFHGGLYWYKRHEMFNANDFFSNRNGLARNIYRYNTLGGTLGGPLYIPGRLNRNKDKLFFFYSTENWSSWSPRPLSQVTVPTALERAGNFSQTLDLNGQVIAIKDPLTGLPFPGNVIPANRINRDGQALLNLFPQPNITDRAITRGNYNYNFSNSWRVPKRNHLGKLDLQADSRDRISVRASHWSSDLQGYGTSAGFNAGWPMLSTHYVWEDDAIALNYTRTISPTMVNEFNAGARHSSEYTSPVDPAAVDGFVRSKVGISLGQLYPQNNDLNLIPQATFGGVPAAAALTYDLRTFLNGGETTFNYSDNFSWTRGSHALKFGFFAERARANKGNAGAFGGNFAFGRDVNNPLDTNYAYSNAMLGVYASYAEDQFKPSANERHLMLQWFAQDTWKLTRRLTLDYGMRFVWATPWSILNGKSSGFALDRYNPAKAPQLFQPTLNSSNARVGRNPVTGQLVPAVLIGAFVPNTGDVLNGMVLGTDPNYPTGFMEQQSVHPEPRVGFAYDVFGDGSTAIRSSFGITHALRSSSNTPNVQARNNPPQQFSPITYYGSMDTLLGATGYLSPTTVYGWDRNTKTPAVYNYTFGIQRKVLGTIIDASYVGNVGRHLTWARDLGLVPYGARFLPQHADPTNTRVPLPDKFFNPIPGYGSVQYIENAGSSNYNSLQVTANRRFTSGLQFGLSYTWSKAMTFADYDFGGTALVATYRPVRVWNYGKSTSFDQTQNLVFNFIYDLPKLAPQAYNPVARQVLNGWQVAGLASFVSGIPTSVGYSLVDGADITGGGDGGRIVVTGKAQLDRGARSFSQWFDTKVFARPARGDYGNAPKDVYRGPGINNWDLSFFKDFPLGRESRFIQFRWEMYNAFNHTQFLGVDNAARFDAAGNQVNNRLGQVISTRTPRVCQAALRFTF